MAGFACGSRKAKASCCHQDLHVNSHEHDVRIFFVRPASGAGRKEGRKETGKEGIHCEGKPFERPATSLQDIVADGP